MKVQDVERACWKIIDIIRSPHNFGEFMPSMGYYLSRDGRHVNICVWRFENIPMEPIVWGRCAIPIVTWEGRGKDVVRAPEVAISHIATGLIYHILRLLEKGIKVEWNSVSPLLSINEEGNIYFSFEVKVDGEKIWVSPFRCNSRISIPAFVKSVRQYLYISII